MSQSINVTSEIGRLKKVILHRPGKEIENLVPAYLDRLLFDDIPYLKAAKKEHDGFAKILKENGVEVYYVEDLVSEVLENERLKNNFLLEFLKESKLTSHSLMESLSEYLMAMDSKTMVDTLISGVRKDEIKIKKISSLIEIMDNKYPFYLDPMPNLYFTRDPAAAIGRGLSINRMHTLARRRESLFLECIYKEHPLFKSEETPLWYKRDVPYSIEGGDQLVLSDKVLAVGCSERTSPEGIEMLAQNLLRAESGFERVLVFEIPSCRAFMHLDTVFTMVDYDKFTIHPEIEGPLNVYEITKGKEGALIFNSHKDVLNNILKNVLKLPSVELLRCGGGDAIIAGREQWNDGSNTLAISPGTVITYERNYVTNELLEKNNIKVLTMPSSELSRGRGGPRCMSMPIWRENI
ncbi:arginine deiminase [Clostridium sp. MSJ-4]|uniref:Arginine deiminase n=1 Tax=Clostridium simiarum TaxID=2841506 RepID=A0ABS6EXJ2_9CLOT|nr:MULTISPECIES: arginine deiminase [Clostridium]MBU5590946.1 arginine deiminase [Clostridium simiarum]